MFRLQNDHVKYNLLKCCYEGVSNETAKDPYFLFSLGVRKHLYIRNEPKNQPFI